MLFSQICKSTKRQEGGNLPLDDSQEQEDTSIDLPQLTTGGEATVEVAEDNNGSSGHTNVSRVAIEAGHSCGDCKTLVRTTVL